MKCIIPETSSQFVATQDENFAMRKIFLSDFKYRLFLASTLIFILMMTTIVANRAIQMRIDNPFLPVFGFLVMQIVFRVRALNSFWKERKNG